MEKTIDCKAMACPLPVVNAKKAAAELTSGDTLSILVDNEIAVQNLQRLAAHLGYPASARKCGADEFSVTMLIRHTPDGSSGEQAQVSCAADLREKGLLAVLSSDTMGSGDPRLGASLMKAFVFALTRQDQLPETILCYNSGAYLSCEGSDTLEDLRALEAEGVTVLTCGTCLDFYGLKDKLAVGSVTNMYDIVLRMESAQKILKP